MNMNAFEGNVNAEETAEVCINLIASIRNVVKHMNRPKIINFLRLLAFNKWLRTHHRLTMAEHLVALDAVAFN